MQYTGIELVMVHFLGKIKANIECLRGEDPSTVNFYLASYTSVGLM